jgi:hypothetical protein
MRVVGVREDQQKAGGIANLLVAKAWGPLASRAWRHHLLCGWPGRGADAAAHPGDHIVETHRASIESTSSALQARARGVATFFY